MKSRKIVVPLAVLAGLLIAAWAIPLLAEDEEHEGSEAKNIADALKQVKVTLVQAIAVAEKKTGGTAFAARLETDDEEIAYEVQTVVVTGETAKLQEVDVDAKTGKIVDEQDEKEGREKGDDEKDEDDGGD
jgi:uncharacterized membrane protein YkoI